jgi:endo-1,4-beta-mannosidase
MKLSFVSIEGNYFNNNNGPFIPVGAHWVPATGLHWPVEWDPESIRADFEKMKDLGFNTMRFDLFWAWFEPYPGSYNNKAFDQFDYFIQLAHEYQIYLHPCLFIGGETGYYDVPWRHGRHPQADPEMLRLQTNHARELVRRYRNEPAIQAWDLTDEPPFWIVRPPHTTDAMAINWTRLIAGAVRRADPNHLVCVGTDQEDLRRGPFRPDNISEEVDFFSAHPYPIYMLSLFPDPMLSERMTYCGAFQTTLSSVAGHPVMVHELGASSAQYKPEVIAAYDRTSIYSALAAGANGFLLWDYTDASPEAWKRAPYKITPHETQFGLTTWDRKDRPAGKAFRKIAQILSSMDLRGMAPEAAQVALLVPYEWTKPAGDYSRMGMENPAPGQYVAHHSDSGAVSGLPPRDTTKENNWLVGSWLSAFISLRRAGLKVAMPRELTAWNTFPMLALPSPLTSTEVDMVHVHSTFWSEAREYVRQGETLYASLCADAAIPEMADWLGAEMVDHDPVEEIELIFEKDFGNLKKGEVLKYHPSISNPKHWGVTLDVAGGEVIAVDQKGRPALVSHTFGAGRTLLCAYPIEAVSAATPSVFESLEPTWRIYKALAEWANVSPIFCTDTPAVEAGSILKDGSGYCVLVNHTNKEVRTTLSSNLTVLSMNHLFPGSKEAMQDNNGLWQVDVPAWDGVILEWRADLYRSLTQ